MYATNVAPTGRFCDAHGRAATLRILRAVVLWMRATYTLLRMRTTTDCFGIQQTSGIDHTQNAEICTTWQISSCPTKDLADFGTLHPDQLSLCTIAITFIPGMGYGPEGPELRD